MTEKTEEVPAPAARPEPVDQLVTTEHTITIGGRTLAYQVTTGTIVLREEAEKKGEKEGQHDGHQPRASVFFTAYTLKDARRGRASSADVLVQRRTRDRRRCWLHLGVLGPRRVVMDDVGNLPQPPYALADNAHTLLDTTDLVFIDPMSTGYSAAGPGEKAKEWHSFKKDIESVGDFIRLYTSRYRRWLSPKFLIGESYGTTRAAGLSGYLQDRHGMYLNGLMLVSSVLDFQTLDFGRRTTCPTCSTCRATARPRGIHKRLAPELQKDLQATLREARRSRSRVRAGALARGGDAGRAEEGVAAKIARYTGLSAGLRSSARTCGSSILRFTKELLRDQRRTVGRLDSRFTGIDRDAVGEAFEHDPSMVNIMGPVHRGLQRLRPRRARLRRATCRTRS